MIESPTAQGDQEPVDLPRFISADDHVIEPPHVWQENLPTRHQESGPQLVKRRGRLQRDLKAWVLTEDQDGEWADCWAYDGALFPILRNLAAVSYPRGAEHPGAATFDELRPGCFEQKARLADMDLNHTEASLCFPTFPRFCGQTFLEARDRDLAESCVRAYNDWMIDDWCGGDGRGRLVPLTLMPLWDSVSAAAEIRRCAAKGSHAVCFTESPTELDLPSVFSDFWEPVWQACDETSTVVNIHIGSSSSFMTTSRDAPPLVPISLTHVSAERTLVDWLSSGILERYPTIKMVLSEGQAGWMPFVLDRMDRSQAQWSGNLDLPISRAPSSYVPGHVYTCIFEDDVGLRLRDRLGGGQIMFEIDYPHTDSTWPSSEDVVRRMVAAAGMDSAETRHFVRGNAVECFGLDRYGIAP